jgi:hypothetical protein
MATNKKQIKQFTLRPDPQDSDQFILQTASGTTLKTTKSALLNDVNSSLVGLQNQIDNLDFTYATDTILAAISGDIQEQLNKTDWTTLATTWTSTPTLNINISGGDVYDYEYGSTTYYRFVSEPYDSTLDSFYSAFDGSNLTGLIATRGQSI